MLCTIVFRYVASSLAERAHVVVVNDIVIVDWAGANIQKYAMAHHISNE